MGGGTQCNLFFKDPSPRAINHRLQGARVEVLVIKTKDDGGLDLCGGSGRAKQWLDSGYILSYTWPAYFLTKGSKGMKRGAKSHFNVFGSFGEDRSYPQPRQRRPSCSRLGNGVAEQFGVDVLSLTSK